ncbi:SGNH/GDSL hydrolase family protein [Corynebacterium breve]|uniref:SGNH/GDSL hydrolase family protein n=1 Tax=Corynebacterium breve TaxID=3049799 RepID=A0ABY8VD66_9CORY|nr:SGNH/GDSL hydrolase family protein [Corynebacterium breve]WIM67052.1 SGNH/GDSL hydrolase family protein [Corynebacterium breve]
MIFTTILQRLMVIFSAIGLIFASGSSFLTDGSSGSGDGSSSSEVEEFEPTPVAPEDRLNYVGLGDSYAALGSKDVEHTGPENCYRSSDNYGGNILASGLVQGQDISCSGAETDSITGWQYKPDDDSYLPPQVDVLSEETDLITLTIGANDLGYWDIKNCFQAHITGFTQSACKDELSETVSAELQALPAKLDDVYAEIDTKAPNARVITGGYLPIIAAGDTCVELAFISRPDREWIIDFTNELNTAVKEAAERNGATYVMPANVEDHTGCAPVNQRYVDFTGAVTKAYPFHPTALGHKAMAQAMLKAI